MKPATPRANRAPDSEARVFTAPAYSYAFQPIIDTEAECVLAYEALIRGIDNASARSILRRVPLPHAHDFDRQSRNAAIMLAARLGIPCDLHLNLLPRGLLPSDKAIEATLEAAERHGLPIQRIVLEVTEGEVIDSHTAFAALINRYRGRGLKVAIDDFGAGYAGLNLLAELQPDQVKVGMKLVRGIDHHGPRQAIVGAIIQACSDLGIDVIALGVETPEEFAWFSEQRVSLFQGHLFARPGFEQLPEAHFPSPH